MILEEKVPEELNEEGAYVIGRAYGTFLTQRRINESVVTCDNRLTSEDIKKALCRAHGFRYKRYR